MHKEWTFGICKMMVICGSIGSIDINYGGNLDGNGLKALGGGNRGTLPKTIG